jgi:hypothetical protein
MKLLYEYVIVNLVLFMIWSLLVTAEGTLSAVAGALIFFPALVCLMKVLGIDRELFQTDR